MLYRRIFVTKILRRCVDVMTVVLSCWGIATMVVSDLLARLITPFPETLTDCRTSEGSDTLRQSCFFRLGRNGYPLSV